jgi:hypothetical protein
MHGFVAVLSLVTGAYAGGGEIVSLQDFRISPWLESR